MTISNRSQVGMVDKAVVLASVGLSVVLLLGTIAQAAIVHQYTFNDGTANDAVGGQHGTVVDPGNPTAIFGAGLVDLSANSGESSNGIVEDAYIDLPNSIASSAAATGTAGAVSFEVWVAVETNRNWAEIFCFGTSDGGEDISGGGGGSDYLPLIPQNGQNGSLRLSNHSGSGIQPAEPSIDDSAMLAPTIEHQLVGVYDETDLTAGPDGTMYLYRDGNLVGSNVIHPSLDLASLPDNNNWLGRSQYPDPLFDGAYNEFRIYDHALSAQEVAASFSTGPEPFQGPTLTIDRATGSLLLSNGGLPVQVVGYSLTSQVGALDTSAWISVAGNYDVSVGGDGSFDPNDSWSVVSSTFDDLSEQSNGTTGGRLDAAGVVLSSGEGWVPSPIEDLQMTVELADGSFEPVQVQYTGNGDTPFVRSDLNFDGAVDRQDWPTFRAGILTDLSGLSLAHAYGRGDLDGDGDSDAHDFRIFKVDFDAAQGPGAFDAMITGVPEPSSLLLLSLGVLIAAAMRARGRGARLCYVLVAAIASLTAIQSPSAHADLVHKYTFNNGTADDSRGTAHGTLVDPGGLAIYSETGRLDVSANNGESSNQDWSAATTGIYVDLPNGIVSSAASGGTRGAITFEAWVAVETNRTWAEIFSFGTSDGGEDSSGGAGFSDSIPLIPQNGQNGNLRLSNRSGSGNEPVELVVDDVMPLPTGMQQHLVGVFDKTEEVGDVNGTMRLYRNGQLLGTGQIHPDLDMTQMINDNNWLGRSQWPDPLFDGAFNEFRIYDHALSAEEVAESFSTGPDDVVLLGLEVDKVTGRVTLKNKAAFEVEFDYYQITSDGGALDPTDGSGWDSLSDQDFQTSGSEEGQSWDEADASNEFQLAELYLDGTSVLASGDSVRLGNAFDTSVFGPDNEGDLLFQYALASGEIVNGVVDYVTRHVLLGDLNLDGLVNGLDVDPFVDRLLGGSYQVEADMNEDGQVNGLDVDPFVAAIVGGGVAAVPEPSTLVLTVGLLSGALVFWRRSNECFVSP